MSKRAVITYKSVDDKICYCNVSADYLVDVGEFVQAWDGENLAGIFKKATLISAYISEKKEKDDV